MSRPEDSREGLSPAPPNILDILTVDDEDSDDVEFEPSAEDQTTDASGLTCSNEDGDSDADFTGTMCWQLACVNILICLRCPREPAWNRNNLRSKW